MSSVSVTAPRPSGSYLPAISMYPLPPVALVAHLITSNYTSN